MNRKKPFEEVPSIIQEIVFYDKPNLKTIVPEEILPEARVRSLGKGDLVLSCIRKSSLSKVNFQKDHEVESNLLETGNQESEAPDNENRLESIEKTIYQEDNSLKISNIKIEEPGKSKIKNVESLVVDKSVSLKLDVVGNHSLNTLKEEVNIEKQSHGSIDSLNHFVEYENLDDDLLEPMNIVQKSSTANETSVEPQEPIEKLHDSGKNFKAKKHCLEIKINKKGISQSDEIEKQPSQLVLKSTKKRSPVLSVEQTVISHEPHKKSPKERKVLAEDLGSKKNNATKRGGKDATSSPTKKSPLKKLNGFPAKKSAGKLQKTTMLSYFSVEPKLQVKQESPSEKSVGVKKNTSESIIKAAATKKGISDEKKQKADKTERESQSQVKGSVVKKRSSVSNKVQKGSKSSPEKKVEPRQSRGRPKRTAVVERIVKAENYYSDEDVSFKSPEKRKNYVELTNVSLDSTGASVESSTVNTEGLEDLLDETREQTRTLDRVEEDLQNMFKSPQDQVKKQGTKGKRKSLSRKSKDSEMLAKRVKKEVDDTEEQSNDDSLTIPNNEDYDSEDSRGEWLPEEYVEYRQQHVMKQQSKMFQCKFCNQKFPSYYSMRKHRALAHDDVGQDRKEGTYKAPVRCKQEKDQDASDEESREEWMPADYADYKLKHKLNKMKRVQWYKCKICCAVFSNYYKLSKHRVEHENKPNPYECKQCDARFKDVETLMAHLRVHQGKDPYECKKCDKGFMTKAELDEHTPVHILKKAPSAPKRFRCDVCSKEFSKLCDIERHTRVHTGEKPCECNICHKRFQQSHNLSKHLLTHLHVKPFQCEICNKKFGRIDVLNRHLLTHSMEKPFNCEICSKGFIRQVQLTNHIEKIHTSSDKGLVAATEDDPNEEEQSSEENIEIGHFEAVIRSEPSEEIID